MKMQFIGKDSLGYINGKIYEVEIMSQDDMIILHSNGHPNCPYQSLKVLLKNWKELNPQMPTNEEIAKVIQDSINNNPDAFLGVMNLDGSLNCKLTVKAKGYKEF